MPSISSWSVFTGCDEQVADLSHSAGSGGGVGHGVGDIEHLGTSGGNRDRQSRFPHGSDIRQIVPHECCDLSVEGEFFQCLPQPGHLVQHTGSDEVEL